MTKPFRLEKKIMFRKILLSVVSLLFALCSLLVFIGAIALFFPFAALAGIALLLLFFSLSIFDSVTGLLDLKNEINDVKFSDIEVTPKKEKNADFTM